MKVYIQNDRLYKKTLFSTTEIAPGEINRIVVEDSATKIFMKSGKTIEVKYALNGLFEKASWFVKNNVSYEDRTYEGRTYTAPELKKQLDRVAEKAQNIATKIVKGRLGDKYAIDASIVGEGEYSILVFRLVENGIVLTEHPTYEEIGELGVDKAIDEMDLSFLVKWDSTVSEGAYGVTTEVDDEHALEEYVADMMELIFEKAE